MRRLGVHEKSDERILGRGEFVEQLIKESDQTRQEQFFDKERLHRVQLPHNKRLPGGFLKRPFYLRNNLAAPFTMV